MYRPLQTCTDLYLLDLKSSPLIGWAQAFAHPLTWEKAKRSFVKRRVKRSRRNRGSWTPFAEDAIHRVIASSFTPVT